METSDPDVADSSATVSDVLKPEIDSVTQAMDDPISPRFSVDQEVIAIFRDTYYYRAKVIKIEFREGNFKYKVHYVGWKKRWDEWLNADQLMENTEKNSWAYPLGRHPLESYPLGKKKKSNAKKIQPGCSSSSSLKSNSNLAEVKKQNVDSAAKDKEEIPMEKLVSIQIPPTLKKQLLDDCEFVNHMGKLVKLPRIPSVNDIFVKYLEYKEQKDGLDDSIGQFVRLFQSYFDKALPAMLLYKGERMQYEQATPVGTSPSSVYGAEHLLRLFVKFPELLLDARNDGTIDEVELIELQQKLIDLLKFLRKNQSGFFLSTYHVAEAVEMSTTKRED